MKVSYLNKLKTILVYVQREHTVSPRALNWASISSAVSFSQSTCAFIAVNLCAEIEIFLSVGEVYVTVIVTGNMYKQVLCTFN